MSETETVQLVSEERAPGAEGDTMPRATAGTPLSAESLAVTVTFAPTEAPDRRFVLSGQGVVPGTSSIDVYVDLAEITLTLELAPGVSGEARLASHPIQWVERDLAGALVPSGVPANMWEGEVVKGRRVTLIDRRVAESAHSFFLSVVYGEALYSSSDPTVVNKWPPFS